MWDLVGSALVASTAEQITDTYYLETDDFFSVNPLIAIIPRRPSFIIEPVPNETINTLGGGGGGRINEICAVFFY